MPFLGSPRERYEGHSGATGNELGTRLVFELKMKPCASAPTKALRAKQPGGIGPLFANPLILHHTIKSTIFSLNGLLYLRRSRAFAQEIPCVSELNITGCEPKGVHNV